MSGEAADTPCYSIARPLFNRCSGNLEPLRSGYCVSADFCSFLCRHIKQHDVSNPETFAFEYWFQGVQPSRPGSAEGNE
jgi:hypothetical protein